MTAEIATTYRRLHRNGGSALWCYRKAREQVAAAKRLAFRTWCAEMGFALSMIGLQAACAESDEAYEARTRRAA